MMPTAPGSVVAQRFELLAPAGVGGMATVFRARDLETGRLVALKLLPSASQQPQDLSRFVREAQLLSELSHPGIVSYIAHGRPEHGVPYLAMEWLEGEDLGSRLARSPLTLEESLLILTKTTAALAVAHSRGIVHRDLKPTNLFLRDGQIERVTLIDFGIARRAIGQTPMTRSGMVIGTLDYMAPEQARGQKELGPAADIFSLGCVLYECLTGQPPFFGDQVSAVLAKILFEEAPPLRRFLPHLPQSVEDLVKRMLLKDAAQRPADAAMLLGELAALGDLSDREPRPPVPASTIGRSLADSEQMLVSVVAAYQLPQPVAGQVELHFEASLSEDELASTASLRKALTNLGARCEVLADGSLIAALNQPGSATDQVAQTARCALLVFERWPSSYVGLATGRGTLDGRTVIGEAIDRAVRLVRAQLLKLLGTQSERLLAPTRDGIWLDDVSAGLLDRRFEMRRTEHGVVMLRERIDSDEGWTALDESTPFLGREHELLTLDGMLDCCVDESEVRAMLVLGPVGVGKSRLRHEFVRRLAERRSEVSVLVGRGDPMSTFTPYALIAQALRRACGAQSGSPLHEQQSRLESWVGRHVLPAAAPQIAEFLGELCGIPFSDEGRTQLRAARQDPKLMREQICHAFLDLLRAECLYRPVLLILEDLHSADQLTIQLIDTVLRDLRDLPLMVLGLARPEVVTNFPNLWAERCVQEFQIGPLPRKIGEKLVLHFLGSGASPAVVTRIVDQASGNALYLEELVRAVADGKGDALPQTVLAMLQSRIAGLDASSRRVLRAASIFGTTFWLGGLRALSGGKLVEELEHWLEQLLSAEIIERHRESRLPGELEFGFRQSLMREAAYSMLTDEDLLLGHSLAAAYLARAGEPNAVAIAEHLRLAGEREGAIPYYLRAAEQLYASGDVQGTLKCAALAVGCGARGAALGTARALEAVSHYWRADWTAATAVGQEALALLPPGGIWWYGVMAALLVTAANGHSREPFQSLVSSFASLGPSAEARGPYVATAAQVVTLFSFFGQRDQARLFLAAMQRAAAGLSTSDLLTRGSMNEGHGWYALMLSSDLSLACALAQESVSAFRQAGDSRGLMRSRTLHGMVLQEIGDLAAAEKSLREAVALADEHGEPLGPALAKVYLAVVLSEQPEGHHLEEARQLATSLLPLSLGPSYAGFLQLTLSHISCRQGHFAEAEQAAGKALSMLTAMRPWQLAAFVRRIRALLAQGPSRAPEARAFGEAALQSLRKLDGNSLHEVRLQLAVAEARYAVGSVSMAHEALREALRQLRLRANLIPDPLNRERFLRDGPDSARVLFLAGSWLGEML